jgi:hypothetical protein
MKREDYINSGIGLRRVGFSESKSKARPYREAGMTYFAYQVVNVENSGFFKV